MNRKKSILCAIAFLAIAGVTAFNLNLGSKSSNLSSLALQNIEVLAYGEGDEREAIWVRKTDNCYFSATGLTPNTTVTFGGKTYTVGTDGKVSVFIAGGDVTCGSGGYDLCEPQNCN